MVTAYPMRAKAKSLEICRAFIEGCRGTLARDSVLREGTAAFYGIDDANEHVWQDAKARGDYVYIDNAYFDSCRGRYFRITRNATQHSGLGKSSGKRFADLGVSIQPWRAGGAHIVVCPQSEHYMRVIAGLSIDWTESTINGLAKFSNLPIRLRQWSRDKGVLASTLKADLRDAAALVTWSSAAAVTAVLEGVPIAVTGPSAAAPMAGDLADVDHLPRPQREQWAGVLADNQWTLAEMADGTAWRSLNS